MTNNTNNTNNATSTNSAGNTGTSSGDPGSDWTFPDRANLPFVDDPGLSAVEFPDTGYGDRFWSPIWNAWRILPEYTLLDWRSTDPGPPSVAAGTDELKILSDYARFERGDALGEILAQKDEFISHFMGLLVATPATHPNTYRLMHLMNLIGAFTVMYVKGVHKRMRPSQLLPLLRPPIQVPGHASYPSGHSTQANLIALATILVLPANPATTTNLNGLAARIARNRELGGLHYPSDTAGGLALASNIHNLMEADRGSNAPLMPGYVAAVSDAVTEWS